MNWAPERGLDAPPDGYPPAWREQETVELPLDAMRRLVLQAEHGRCGCRLCDLAIDEALRYAVQPGETMTIEGGHAR